MTSQRRFDQELPNLLADLYMRPAPDYRHDIVRRAATTRQRPAWTFPERWLPMTAITLGRQTLRPIPWRPIVLLAVLGALLVAILAVYVGGSRTVPAPYGVARNGLVATSRDGDIVLVDPVTNSVTVLVGGPGVDTMPVFSRDGTRLAFRRGTPAASSAWVVNLDGTQLRQLPSDPIVADFGAGPSPMAAMEWAPDGRSIVVSTARAGVRGITILAADGSGARAVPLPTGMRADGPTWRPPDGREILFRATTDEGFHLYAVRPDGTGLRAVTPEAGRAEWDALFFGWSPDGSRVVYQWRETAAPQAQRLYVIPGDGGEPRPITAGESVGATWSPDGTKIAFFDAASAISGDVAPVSVVNVDGANDRTALSSDGGGWFTWAPDSKAVAWLTESEEVVLLGLSSGSEQRLPWSAESMFDWQRLAP
jgi:Tol biopolymer transport system component